MADFDTDRPLVYTNRVLNEVGGDEVDNEEQVRLTQAIRHGTPAAAATARHELVRANFRYVARQARRFHRPGGDFDDLMQSGVLGLLEAAGRFDRNAHDNLFLTYAHYWVLRYLRDAAAADPIRIPRGRPRSLMAKWRRAGNRLRRKFDRDPTFEETRLALGLGDGDARTVSQVLLVRSVQRDQDPDLPSLDQALAAPEDETREEADAAFLVERMLRLLEPRDRDIIRLYFGIGESRKDLNQIGAMFDITGERVRKLKLRAMETMKRAAC